MGKHKPKKKKFSKPLDRGVDQSEEEFSDSQVNKMEKRKDPKNPNQSKQTPLSKKEKCKDKSIQSVPPWWPGSSLKIIKVNCYVRHNFIQTLVI